MPKAKKQVIAILTADWHLREKSPRCRQDDFWSAQWDKVEQVAHLQREHKCPVLHAGDLFHHWRPSPWLLSQCIKRMPRHFWTVLGNHDLPYHRLDHAERSGMEVLKQAGAVRILSGCHFGEIPQQQQIVQLGDVEVLVWHKFVWAHKGQKDHLLEDRLTKASVVLESQESLGCDVILTGDNHDPFIVAVRDRKLVNPGPLTRQSVDQQPPRVVLLYDDTSVDSLELQYDLGAIVVEEKKVLEQQEKRMQSFIERLEGDWVADMDFRTNLESYARQNKVPPDVMELVWQALDEGGQQ